VNDDFISRFAELHQRGKKAPLSTEEHRDYELLKERFASALCVAQQIMIKPGQYARQTFRMAVLHKVQLTIDGAPQSTVTVDIGPGGFSALLPRAPVQKTGVAFQIALPRVEPVAGTADVVGAQITSGSCRASFKFVSWQPGHQVRLEEALFDAVLARFKR
jgi:hypothetical protein